MKAVSPIDRSILDGDRYPGPTIEECAEKTAAEILRCHAELFLGRPASDRARLPEKIAEAEQLIARMSSASRAALERLGQPATSEEIALHLATMVGSFPDRSKADADVYGNVLPIDVGALQPTLGGIEAGCRNLRRQFSGQFGRRMPSVSEVVTAVREAENKFRSARRALTELPERIAEAKRALISSTAYVRDESLRG
jgi:hypothetical protein